MVDLRIVPTDELSLTEKRALRALLDGAFEDDFTDDDWNHTLGGLHVLALDGGIVSHAAVVERRLFAADRGLRAGYVEGVATAANHLGRGHASTVMSEVGKLIQEAHEIGALATGIPDFFARFGWEPWRGPTYTDSAKGPQRTPDEDGGVMILRTRFTRELDPTAPLMCDWRAGDVW